MTTERELETLLIQGLQHQKAGEQEAALTCYERVLQAMPYQLDAAYFKSVILHANGELDSVIALLSPVVCQAFPASFQAALARCHRMLGAVYQAKKTFDLAIHHFEQAYQLHTEELDYTADLIQALLAGDRIDQAVEFSRQLPETCRQHVRCLAALAEIHWRNWNVQGCLDHLQAAMRLVPGQLDLISQYLFALNYTEEDGPQVAQAHIGLGHALQRYVRSQVEQDQAPVETLIDCDTRRPLRIGFLSPDLKTHSVAYFLLPLLKQLRQKQEVWVAAYALNHALDATSQAILQQCDHFVHLPVLRDLQVIADDKIDILFDLAGHSAGNPLPILLTHKKPAPVIINWLGYANTTGLTYHDYRFVDTITDPFTEKQAPTSSEIEPTSEKRVFLESCFLCYEPPAVLPEVGPSPAQHADYITAGCLNNLNKVNGRTLQLWAELLVQQPRLRLLVKSPMFDSHRVKQRFLRTFLARSLDPERILLLTRSPDTYSHLATYQQIDFTLDTSPYNGTTTTFESLLMGCPVVTLKGRSHRARVSSSILCHFGKNHWIAKDEQSYLSIALQFTQTLSELASIRSLLREELLHSSLCNPDLFANSFLQACQLCKKSVNSK